VIASFASAESSSSGFGEDLAQYLLVCHARTLTLTQGVWCFSLETLAGKALLEAEDEEEGDLNRLSLLAAVRGLEAIDGGAMVSLLSNNRYLIRSLDQSLPRWRENDFIWENFGRKIPVQNADLWRRIDRTLSVHQVTASLVQTTRVSGGSAMSWSGKAAMPGDDSFPITRIDAGHGSVAPPTDSLRRWLAGHSDPVPHRGRRGRYRPEDWQVADSDA
jgi:ribonuclease HI